jgi:hypothetical protein
MKNHMATIDHLDLVFFVHFRTNGTFEVALDAHNAACMKKII